MQCKQCDQHSTLTHKPAFFLPRGKVPSLRRHNQPSSTSRSHQRHATGQPVFIASAIFNLPPCTHLTLCRKGRVQWVPSFAIPLPPFNRDLWSDCMATVWRKAATLTPVPPPLNFSQEGAYGPSNLTCCLVMASTLYKALGLFHKAQVVLRAAAHVSAQLWGLNAPKTQHLLRQLSHSWCREVGAGKQAQAQVCGGVHERLRPGLQNSPVKSENKSAPSFDHIHSGHLESDSDPVSDVEHSRYHSYHDPGCTVESQDCDTHQPVSWHHRPLSPHCIASMILTSNHYPACSLQSV